MATKKTIQEAVQFAATQLKAACVRGARPVDQYMRDSHVSLIVERTFHVQATIHVDFDIKMDGKNMMYVPRVTLNCPAINLPVVQATAMLGLIQELTMLAASLQAQLDEFTIPAE